MTPTPYKPICTLSCDSCGPALSVKRPTHSSTHELECKHPHHSLGGSLGGDSSCVLASASVHLQKSNWNVWPATLVVHSITNSTIHDVTNVGRPEVRHPPDVGLDVARGGGAAAIQVRQLGSLGQLWRLGRVQLRLPHGQRCEAAHLQQTAPQLDPSLCKEVLRMPQPTGMP